MIEYQKDTVIRGLSLSGGLAIARVCLFNSKRHSNLPVYHVAGEGVEREYERLDRALQVAGERLAAVRDRVKERIGAAESEIFTAQQMIMQDESMLTQVRALIDDGGNAEMAIQEVLDRFESRLLAVDNDYIKERASDIGEVKRRLLDVLGNMQPQLQCAGLDHCQHGYNRVVVAEELTPTLTVDLDTQHTLGFVTERGGANSHAAILARALGIPAVSGIKDIHSLISCGTEVLIDGDRGEFIIAPGNETKKRYLAQHADEKNEPQSVAPVEALAVSANISVATDMPMVCRAQAEGIGLYRTEFEFITAGRDLSEDEQFERYASVVRAAKDYPVTFRLLDVGGDKPLAFIDMPREENPALGCRGARFLLRYPALLQTQARAIARASEIAPVRVMYPMIVSKDQFLALKAIFLEAVEVFDPARIAHGVMFEAPSACLQAKAILQVADFASIGTNDLVQYLFAVDRDNELVAADYQPDQEVFWTLIGQIARAALEAGKPLSVCGELAGNPEYIPLLMEAGITHVSVSARLISTVRLLATSAGKQTT